MSKDGDTFSFEEASAPASSGDSFSFEEAQHPAGSDQPSTGEKVGMAAQAAWDETKNVVGGAAASALASVPKMVTDLALGTADVLAHAIQPKRFDVAKAREQVARGETPTPEPEWLPSQSSGGKAITKIADDISQSVSDAYTPDDVKREQAAAQQEIAAAKDSTANPVQQAVSTAGASLLAAAHHPSAAIANIAAQVPALFAALKGGKFAGMSKEAEASKLIQLGAEMSKAPQKFSQQFVESINAKAAELMKQAHVANKVGTAGLFGSQTAMSAGDVVQQSIEAHTDQEMRKLSPRYDGLRNRGLSESEAKAAMVSAARPAAEAHGFGIGFLGGLFLPEGDATGGPAAARATAGTTTSMVSQAGATQAAANVALQQSGADPNRSVTEGVPEAMGQALPSALALGAAAGAGRAVKPTEAAPAPPAAPPAPEGEVDRNALAAAMQEPEQPQAPHDPYGPTPAETQDLAALKQRHDQAKTPEMKRVVKGEMDKVNARIQARQGVGELRSAAAQEQAAGNDERAKTMLAEADKLMEKAGLAAPKAEGIHAEEVTPEKVDVTAPPPQPQGEVPETNTDLQGAPHPTTEGIEVGEQQPTDTVEMGGQKALPAPGQESHREPIEVSKDGVAFKRSETPTSEGNPPPPAGVDVSRAVGLAGGKSKDGKRTYISRMIPQFLDVQDREGKRVKIPVWEEIAKHEGREFPRIAQLGYDSAHDNHGNVATAEFLDQYNVDPRSYQNALRPYIKAAERDAMDHPGDVPSDLDHRPYTKPHAENDVSHLLGEDHPWNKAHSGPKQIEKRAAARNAALKEHEDADRNAAESAAKGVSGPGAVHGEEEAPAPAAGGGEATQRNPPEVDHGAQARDQSGNGEPQHPRAAQRPAVPADDGKPREEGGGQAGGGNRPESAPEVARDHEVANADTGTSGARSGGGAPGERSQKPSPARAEAAAQAPGKGGTEARGAGAEGTKLLGLTLDQLKALQRNKDPDLAAGWETAPGGIEGGHSPASFLEEAHGVVSQAGLRTLQKKGLLNVVPSVRDLPADVRAMVGDRNPSALRDRRNGQVYFIANNITKGKVKSYLLHEIGEHHSMEDMLGSKYQKYIADLRALRHGGSPEVKAAWDRTRQLYQHLDENSDRFVREVAARLIEDHPNLSWGKRVLNEVRGWMYKTFGMGKLDEGTLRGLAAQALRHAADDKGVSWTEAKREPVPVDFALQPTSIKNVVTDAERRERGAPEIQAAAQRSFGKVWKETEPNTAADYQAQVDLVNELNANPRAITDREDAMLLRRKIQLRNERADLSAKINAAHDAGDHAAAVQFSAQWDRAEDALNEVDQAARAAGTETGRGLNARKMMAKEDYTLANMESRMRAAKGGKPLTPKEAEEIRKQHQDIAGKEAQADAQEEKARGTEEVGNEKLNQRLDELKKQFKDNPTDVVTLGQIVDNRIRAGARTFEDVANEVHEEVPEATPEQIERAYKGVRKAVPTHGVEEAGSAKKSLLDSYKSRLQKRIKELQEQIDSGQKNPPKGRKAMELDQEARDLKAKRDALQKEFNDTFGKERTDDQRLAMMKKSAIKRAEDYRTRREQRDFDIKKRAKPPIDAEWLKLKADAERAKGEFMRSLMEAKQSQRTWGERVGDNLAKWHRTFLLSSPTTLAKLFFAAVERAGFSRAEDAAGAVMGKVPGLSQVAAKAPREGTSFVSQRAKDIADALTAKFQYGPEFLKTVKTGYGDLEALYGKMDIQPFDTYAGFPGRVHAAQKSPVKLDEFKRSMAKRIEHGLRNGVDVTDPVVQNSYGVAAYKDARRAVFMQDNAIVDMYKRAISRLKQTPGEPVSYGKKIGETALNVAFPIIKVPTNLALETARYALGGVEGSARLARAFARGMDKLKPEEAEMIMRAFKKGSLGSVALLFGYFNPQSVGGYWGPGEKRSDDEAKFGSVKVLGENVPSIMLHNPLLEAMQVGSTLRRGSDKMLHGEKMGLSNGVWAAALGLADSVPFMNEMFETDKLREPSQRSKYLNQQAENLVVPLGVQTIAKAFDKDENGETVVRDPKTLIEAIESGIPGLRENVPEKVPK